MRYLGLEFYKLKRRHAFLTALVLFLAEAAILLCSLRRFIAGHGLGPALWMDFLMQISMLNGLFCPLAIAVMASRVCDVEHKGDTWKLLFCCSERISSLYDAKFACTLLLVAAAQAVPYFAGIWFGIAENFPGPLPAGRFFASYVGTMMVNVGVLAVQEFFAMAVPNQLIGLVAGLFGSFIGLAGSLFPTAVRRLFFWGYYIELAQARMIETSGKYSITPAGINWVALLCVLAAGMLLYGIGRHWMTRKEL